jgi:hypothetical protein
MLTMEDGPSDADRNLLNRLNALKASSVRLDCKRTPLDFRSSSTTFGNAHDLATRFKSLQFSPDLSTSSSLYDAPTGLFDQSTHSAIDHSLLTNLDSCQDLQEKLWAEERSVQDEVYKSTNVTVQSASADPLKGAHDHDQGDDNNNKNKIIANTTFRLPVNDIDDILEITDHDQKTDDQIAAQYLEDILKKIEILDGAEAVTTELTTTSTDSNDQEPSNGMTSPSDATPNTHHSLELPSVSALPRLPVTQDAHAISNNSNDDLAARFAALRLSLPSVPPHDLLAVAAQPRSLPPTDQVGSNNWCCICSDDAVTRCLDCEEDLQLYCMRCWWEMHLEEGADWALRQHRSVKYTTLSNMIYI